jgi:hypothetical protein
MIKINEIRIGNLLNCGVDEDDSGKEIPMAGRVLQIFQETIHWTNVLNQESIGDGYNSTDTRFIDPIPITPEWLGRLGFKYSKTFKCYSIDFELLFYSEGGEYWLCDQDAGKLQKIGKPFKHVHQLQNIYFALTGEELQLKEA